MNAETAKSTTISNNMAVTPCSLFGAPPLLEGEDSAAYDDLLARVSGDVKPGDTLEEIWTNEIVNLTWEGFRLRRIKAAIIAAALPVTLETVLRPLLAKRTRKQPERPFNLADALTAQYPKLPSPAAYRLAKKWALGDPVAVARVNKLLASAKLTIDSAISRAYAKEFEQIERIDRLATVTEARRNATIREIDRHRSAFAQALQGSVRDIESRDLKIIEGPVVPDNSRTQSAA